jgi:opacity protein-like surface antigen
MGKHVSLRLLLMSGFSLVVALPTAVRAQRPYFNADIGVALPEKVDVRTVNAPGIFTGSTPGVKLDLDPGVRFGIAGGYNFNPFLGAEIETGFIYNSVKNVVGNGSSVPVDSSISHVPLMGNIVLRYDQPDMPWVPYAGAGAGGDLSIVWDNSADDSDTKFVFAWQAFGGVRYKFNEALSLGLGYKYYWVDNATFSLGGGSLGLGHEKIHNFLLEFNVKF